MDREDLIRTIIIRHRSKRAMRGLIHNLRSNPKKELSVSMDKCEHIDWKPDEDDITKEIYEQIFG